MLLVTCYFYPNGHGDNATLDYEARHARFPLSISLPQAGEREEVSLREIHINGHGDNATLDYEARHARFPLSISSPSLSTRKEYADGCPAALQRPNSCRQRMLLGLQPLTNSAYPLRVKRARGGKFRYARFTLTGMAIMPPRIMKLAMPVSLSPSLSRKRAGGKKFRYARFTLTPHLDKQGDKDQAGQTHG